MAEIARKVAPLSYAAFEKHMKYSVNISGEEITLIEKLMRHVNQDSHGEILNKRDMRILKDKLINMKSQMQIITENADLQKELDI